MFINNTIKPFEWRFLTSNCTFVIRDLIQTERQYRLFTKLYSWPRVENKWLTPIWVSDDVLALFATACQRVFCLRGVKFDAATNRNVNVLIQPFKFLFCSPQIALINLYDGHCKTNFLHNNVLTSQQRTDLICFGRHIYSRRVAVVNAWERGLRNAMYIMHSLSKLTKLD